ncbi:MAG: hypothetical protein GY754_11905 [bacterium]|nr:hypothetical protein [bacterium]
MEEPRPIRLLKEKGKEYPDVWKHINELALMKLHNEMDWPDWCYVPLAASYAAVSGGGDNRVSADKIPDVGIVGALATWRLTEGIYSFDESLFNSLWETPIEGKLPIEVLFRLPEWCVYIETPGKQYAGIDLFGFFAHLEYNVSEKRTELRLVLDTEDSLMPIPLHLKETIDDSLLSTIKHSQEMIQKSGIKGIEAGLQNFQKNAISSHAYRNIVTREISHIISLLLYLCTINAEMRSSENRLKTKPDKIKPKKVKKGFKYFPSEKPVKWEVGFRLGVALRKALSKIDESDELAGMGVPKRPHIRRAHYHSFWSGKKGSDDRRLTVKWMPPMSINVDDVDEDLVATKYAVSETP